MSCFSGSPCYSHGTVVYPRGCGIDPCYTHKTGTNLVFYTGANLPCIGVDTCDSVTLAFQKIDQKLCPDALALAVLGSITNNISIRNMFCALVNGCIATTTTTTSSSSTTTTTTVAPSTTTTTTTLACVEYNLYNPTAELLSFSYLNCDGITASDGFVSAGGCISIFAQIGGVVYDDGLILGFGPCISPTTTTTSTSSTTTTTTTTIEPTTTTTTTVVGCNCFTIVNDETDSGVDPYEFSYKDCVAGIVITVPLDFGESASFCAEVGSPIITNFADTITDNGVCGDDCPPTTTTTTTLDCTEYNLSNPTPSLFGLSYSYVSCIGVDTSGTVSSGDCVDFFAATESVVFDEGLIIGEGPCGE